MLCGVSSEAVILLEDPTYHIRAHKTHKQQLLERMDDLLLRINAAQSDCVFPSK